MVQPRPLTGSSSVRPGEAAASPSRAGQVPRGERQILRLCILSASAVRGSGGEIDWESTATEQRRLAGFGFGLALGLDTGERSALGWDRLRELAKRTGSLSLAQGFVAGAGSEQAGNAPTIGDQIEGVVQQAGAIEEAGGVPVLLPLAVLSRRRAREDEYVEVYRTLLGRIGGPVLLDWTGPRERPELLDYFPGKSFERVMALDPAKVRGARFALFDVAREARVRRELLARDQLLFSADRAHISHLLLGANPGMVAARLPEPLRFTEFAGRSVALGEFSHALLSGAVDRAEELAAALERLAAGDLAGYLERVPALD